MEARRHGELSVGVEAGSAPEPPRRRVKAAGGPLKCREAATERPLVARYFFRLGFFFALFEGVLPREAVFAAATWAAFTRWSVTGADFFAGFIEWE